MLRFSSFLIPNVVEPTSAPPSLLGRCFINLNEDGVRGDGGPLFSGVLGKKGRRLEYGGVDSIAENLSPTDHNQKSNRGWCLWRRWYCVFWIDSSLMALSAVKEN